MAGSAVSKRHVFYLSGFDPRGARHYHALYARHAVLQSAVNGLELDVSGRAAVAPHVTRWEARTRDSVAFIDFLGWDDIIRAGWTRGLLARFADVFRYLCDMVVTGVAARVAKTHPMRLIAGFYPVVLLLGAVALAVWACAALSAAYGWMGMVAGLVLAWGILRLTAYLGEKLAAFWLLRIYAFSCRWARDEMEGLDPRLDHFARHIVGVIDRGDQDEIMLVGHSVGTMLAVPVLARVLAARPDARVVLVTLGQCMPLISFQPVAHAFRRALETVARAPQVFWLDYTAPRDGAAFAMMDVAAASGLAPARNLRLMSPRFPRLYTPKTYRRLRYDWYKMHFLYLMSSEKAGDYDYFALTAGAVPAVSRMREAA